jgi:hypothetical protein
MAVHRIGHSSYRAAQSRPLRVVAGIALTWIVVLLPAAAGAQPIAQRGFIDVRDFLFPQSAPNDARQNVADLLAREEVFLKPAEWFQIAGGLDLRANSHDQVENGFDWDDRAIRRPRLAVRRLAVTISKGPLTIDAGKVFIRWARADVLNPTDRFAPRDFMNVLDTDVLPVFAVHPSLHFRNETVEAVWSPQLTPSRLPLFNQRWTVLPPAVQAVPILDGGSRLPSGSEQGVRWSHAGTRFDASLSFFDGFNHLPLVETGLLPTGLELTRVFAALRSYGGDVAVPTRWVTLKGEAAYFTSPTASNDEYVLYVIEVERQIREWVLVGGYAGEAVTENRGVFQDEGLLLPGGRRVFAFAPDRGIAKSFLGRAAYTVDPRRTIAIEAAVRQSGDGLYVKGEYSQAFAQHWRLTLTGVGIEGEPGDFLGQFNHNSNVAIALRFSF